MITMPDFGTQIAGAASILDLEKLADSLIYGSLDSQLLPENRQVWSTTALALEIRALRWSLAGAPVGGDVIGALEKIDEPLVDIGNAISEVAGHLDAVDSTLDRIDDNFNTLVNGPPPRLHWQIRLCRWLFNK